MTADTPEVERLKLAISNTLRSLGYELLPGGTLVYRKHDSHAQLLVFEEKP